MSKINDLILAAVSGLRTCVSASEVAERNSARGVGEHGHVQAARDWRRVGHVPRRSYMDVGTQLLQTYAVMSIIFSSF